MLTVTTSESAASSMMYGRRNVSRSRGGDLVHRVGVGQALDQHDELVTAEARDRRIGPADGLDPAGDLDEQGVADLVTERVVDELEPVDVEQQHRARPVDALQPGQRLVEPVGEQRAVGQARSGCRSARAARARPAAAVASVMSRAWVIT